MKHRAFAVLTALAATCLLPGTAVAAEVVPSLQDEKDTYLAWGWTWEPSVEPDFPGDGGYAVVDPDIHWDTEGDDLWTYLVMYERSGELGYLDRADAWARYFKDDFATCVGSGEATWCYDVDVYMGCHTYGRGLVSLYEVNDDMAALAAAEDIAAALEEHWSTRTDGDWPTPGVYSVSHYGVRQIGRHLQVTSRVAEATGTQRWIDLRDFLIDLTVRSPDWDDTWGMYFVGEYGTDEELVPGAYASGDRLQWGFELGVLAEGLWQAYRTTRREDVRDKLVAMAYFIDKYGIDPTYEYSGSAWGIVDGEGWHNYFASANPTFANPVMTTALVNTLVIGYKLTGDQALLDRARFFFNRGTKGYYGEVYERSAADDEVAHFMDTEFDSSTGNFYLDHNKGEFLYTYLIFENGGFPSLDFEPDDTIPGAPTSLAVL